MATLLTLNILVLAVAAFVGVFRTIPSCAVSLFRYRLWWYRDCLVDDIGAGSYENPEPARRLIEEIEAAIRVAPELTRFRVELASRMAERAGIQSPERIDFDALSEADRTRLGECYDGFTRAVIWKVYAGSPSGWPIAFVSAMREVPAFVADWIRKHRHPPPSRPEAPTARFVERAQSHVADDDIDMDAVLGFLARGSAKQDRLAAAA
jgi:hypothetical protein